MAELNILREALKANMAERKATQADYYKANHSVIGSKKKVKKAEKAVLEAAAAVGLRQSRPTIPRAQAGLRHLQGARPRVGERVFSRLRRDGVLDSWH